MPGNEIGERIHNFFGQENLPQAQHQSQVVDGTWPGFSNGLWIDSQRQVGLPLNCNLKNFNGQQSVDLERGPTLGMQQGLNFPSPALRPELLSSQPHDLHHGTNGYMHGHQPFQAMQNEANVLGLETEPNRRSLMSKGVPMNYDFFGGQQQTSGQYPAMLQSLPRQQAGIVDAQLLQQQVLLRQMQEFQRQQQQGQQEARQFSSVNPGGMLSKQANDTISAGRVNATSLHETSSNSWQPELMTVNPNWLQSGISHPVVGSSSGHILSHEHGQMRMLGLVPQQFDQSLYGVPVSSTRVLSNFSSLQMDKPVVQTMPANSYPFPSNPYTSSSNQAQMQHNSLLSGDRNVEKNMFASLPSEGSSKGHHLGNAQPINPPEKNMFLQGISARQKSSGASEQLQEKPIENATPSHHVSALDPTEEKILFGSDDNLWEAFGNSSNMSSGLSGSDTFGAFSSVNCGSWSALMQSAVAETCSGDTGIQCEWSGLNASSNGPPCGNLYPSTVHDGTNQHSAWINNIRIGSTPNSRPYPPSGNINSNVDICGVMVDQQSALGNSFAQSERLHADTTHTVVQQFLDGGSKRTDNSSLPKPGAESQEIVGDISLQPVPAHGSNIQPSSLPHTWKYVDSVSSVEGASLRDLRQSQASQGSEAQIVSLQNLGKGTDSNSAFGEKGSSTARDDQESRQQHSNSLSQRFVDATSFRLNSSRSDPSGARPLHLDRSTPVLNSSANIGLGKGSTDSHDMGNSTRENLHDSFSPNTSAGGLSDNNRHNVGDTHVLPGGKQKPTGQAHRKPPLTRKFQYHPMGDIDLDEEPSYARATNSQPMSQLASRGDRCYPGQTKSLNHMARNYMEVEKGHLPQVDSVRMDEAPLKSVDGGSRHGSASFDRSVANCDQHKDASSSQNMLELLQKVDQSRENGRETCFSFSDVNWSSVIPEGKSFDGSVVHLQQNQPSAGQGFSLQLGPPSQRVSTPDHASSSQSVLSSTSVPSQTLASKASVSSFSSHEAPQGAFWKNVPGTSGHTNNSNLQYNIQATGFLHGNSRLKNQNMIGAGGQIATSLPSAKFASQLKQREEPVERARKSSSEPSLPDMLKDSSASSSERSQQHANHATDADQGFPMLEATPASHPCVTAGMLQQSPSLLKPEGLWANTSAQQHTLGIQPLKSYPDMLKSRFSPTQIMNSSAIDHLDGGDHSQISPQMAPSWFNQYGLLKNGQVLPVYDAQRSTFPTMKEQPFVLGKPLDGSQSHKGVEQTNNADASQPANVRQIFSIMSKTNEPLVSPQSLPPDDNLAVVGQKKRRTETLGNLSWSKLVTQGSQCLQSVSAAEIEWARTTNRLTEKLEEETELIEDVPPVVRSKRRLVLTTQLMQQLLRPPQPAVLCSDAASNCETVAYVSARSSLGDTCSWLSSFKKESTAPSGDQNQLAEKEKTRERLGDQYVSKATEDFINRAKKLESDLLSLDRRTSITDLRMECQDLEKCSVMNRYAKFHVRAQADGAEPSNFMDPSRNYQKFHFQRYVSAIPMPCNVPDRVQCYSL